jgi:lysozyme family protein
MAASSYDACEARLLVHEGGYTNDPRDPGGPTNWGITIADYRHYKMPNATAADVKAMPLADAKDIYRRKYWVANGLSCDDLPAGVDDSVFDYRVNSGIGRADKVLRRVLGLPDDAPNGVVIGALEQRDTKAVINAINDERIAFLRSLRTWDHFGAGWGRRVAEVRAFSLQLAEGAAPPTPVPSDDVQHARKGRVPAPTKARTDIKTAGTTATATATAAAHGHPALAAAAIIGGAVVTLGALWWINRKHQAAQEAPIPNVIPVPAKAA